MEAAHRLVLLEAVDEDIEQRDILLPRSFAHEASDCTRPSAHRPAKAAPLAATVRRTFAVCPTGSTMRAQPAPARLRPGRGDAHRELAHLLEPPQSLRG